MRIGEMRERMDKVMACVMSDVKVVLLFAVQDAMPHDGDNDDPDSGALSASFLNTFDELHAALSAVWEFNASHTIGKWIKTEDGQHEAPHRIHHHHMKNGISNVPLHASTARSPHPPAIRRVARGACGVTEWREKIREKIRADRRLQANILSPFQHSTMQCTPPDRLLCAIQHGVHHTNHSCGCV